MKKNLKRVLCVFMSLVMLLTASVPNISAAEAEAVTAVDASKLWTDTYVTSEKEYRLVSGVVERDIILNNAAKTAQKKCFVMEVDLNNPDVTIIAGYNDYTINEWKRTPVREQAYAAEEKRGVNVIGAINGDRYNTETGEPAGLLIMDSIVCHTANGRPFFAILTDGSADIRYANESKADVVEAISGFQILVKDGKNIAPANKLNPRTCIGIKADGTVVMFVVDGRQDPDSVGMDYPEMAATMLALGCVDVLELDGGGSSTMLAQREASGDLDCRNSPSYGYERTVSSSLLVCTTAKPTGIFDHITFSETEYIVSPYEAVYVNAMGVDANGYETDFPEGGKLVLSKDNMGSLKGSNLFVSNGTLGTVNLNYVVGDEIIASATITITNDADNIVETMFGSVMDIFYIIINMFKLLIDKFGEKVLGKV